MQSRVLLFSIGLNGYDVIYSKCIESHRLYAQKQGYDYVLVNRPRWSARPEESAWLKIALVVEALRTGYDWVFFIDADCEIRRQTPRIESLELPGKLLYLAHGFSGRVNSGVIVVKNTSETRALFQRILDAADTEVPEEDRALYENGHVIHYSKSCDFLEILDRRWNNNTDVDLDDFIRHYSGGGPMRSRYRGTRLGRLVQRAVQVRSRLLKKLRLDAPPRQPLTARLCALTRRCRREFPMLAVRLSG